MWHMISASANRSELHKYSFENYTYALCQDAGGVMTAKPDHVFDRDREWDGLTSFAQNPHPGAMLGVVSGRRRQGKSFLMEALTSATGGLYFPALQQTEALTLRSFTAALIRQGVAVSQPLRSWEDAITLLFSGVRDHPRAIVIDEFPFLVKASP
ncbi:MAG: hypothetical protein J2P32_05370, partial [Actinobacteria bacterium]|nr:hypothetical protein [Actinomycetota bacterium]